MNGLQSSVSIVDGLGIESDKAKLIVGAEGSLSFGFALDDFFESTDSWAQFWVYDESGNQLATDFEYGLYTSDLSFPGGTSSFPEGRIEMSFVGTAASAVFDFNNNVSGGQRYIIDNFAGTFGTTEQAVPDGGATLFLLGCALLGLPSVRRKLR